MLRMSNFTDKQKEYMEFLKKFQQVSMWYLLERKDNNFDFYFTNTPIKDSYPQGAIFKKQTVVSFINKGCLVPSKKEGINILIPTNEFKKFISLNF